MKEVKIKTFYGDEAHIIEHARQLGKLRFRFYKEDSNFGLYACDMYLEQSYGTKNLKKENGYFSKLENNLVN